MDDDLILVSQEFEKDTINQQRPIERQRKILCEIKSISRAEWSTASMQGLKPDIQAVTPFCNYFGERVAIWRGVRYTIYRTFLNSKTDEIELYLSREVGA